MKVAIIGTGNVGKALGTSLTRAGHDVTFAARDAVKTRQVADEVGAEAAESPAGAAESADVIILGVPYAALADVAREIASAAEGKVVVDTTNPVRSDFTGLATAGGPSAAEQLADNLTNSRVAKAFNTLFSSVQANPDALGTTIDALFATDDEEARRTLDELIASIGFRPVSAGSLARARELEALAWLNMGMQMQFGGAWRSAFVVVEPPAGATSDVSETATA